MNVSPPNTGKTFCKPFINAVLTHTCRQAHVHAHTQTHTLTHIYLLTKTQAPNKCLTFFLRLYKLQLSGRAQLCHCPRVCRGGMQAPLSVCGPDKVSSSTSLPAKSDRLRLHFCKLFYGCQGFVGLQHGEEKEKKVCLASRPKIRHAKR